MKKTIVLFALSCLPLVVAQAQNDSIRSESLPEVVVTADGQIEMPIVSGFVVAIARAFAFRMQSF